MTFEELLANVKLDGSCITTWKRGRLISVSVSQVIELMRAAYDAGKESGSRQSDDLMNAFNPLEVKGGAKC